MPRLSGTFGAARLHRLDSSSDGADDDGSDRPWLKGTTLGAAVAAILDRNQLFDGETGASVAAEVRRLHGLWKDEAGAAPWRARRLRSEENRLPAEAYDVIRELCVLSKPVWKSNLQPDFDVSVFECFDTRISAALRELDESNRSVQKSAESTSIRPS